MNIFPLKAFHDNYIWIILNKNTNSFICVDPGDATPVLNYAKENNLKLDNILITHHHSDHSAGVMQLKNHFPDVKVYAPKDTRIYGVTHYVTNKEIIHIDNLEFYVLATPGHTATHICYVEKKCSWLFCGDTLFSAGCGRVFDGTIEELHESIQLLRNLDSKTNVFCGHEYTRQNLRFAVTIEPHTKNMTDYLEYLEQNANICSLPSTIELERKINPFMRTCEPEVINYAKTQNLKTINSLNVFKLLRKQKDAF